MKINNTLILGIILLFGLNAHSMEKTTLMEVMSAEQKAQAADSFRENFQLIHELKQSGKSNDDIIALLAKKEFAKQKNDNEKLSSVQANRLSSGYGDGFSKVILDNKYLVTLAYNNDGGYPILYGGSGKFRDNKQPDFFQSKSSEILSVFLGNNHQELNAQLIAVTKVVAIQVEINSPEQFDQLLSNPRLIGVNHLGNPPNSGAIYVDD